MHSYRTSIQNNKKKFLSYKWKLEILECNYSRLKVSRRNSKFWVFYSTLLNEILIYLAIDNTMDFYLIIENDYYSNFVISQ